MDRSALYHAHRIKTDTLILHGRFDDRAPVDQAERFSAALSATGVPVALNIFECGHRIPREQRTPVFRVFFRKYLLSLLVTTERGPLLALLGRGGFWLEADRKHQPLCAPIPVYPASQCPGLLPCRTIPAIPEDGLETFQPFPTIGANEQRGP